MICSRCGGLVTWRGPFIAPTHTECERCGGVNCHLPPSPAFSRFEHVEVSDGDEGGARGIVAGDPTETDE